MRREDDLQFFSAVRYILLESKNFESLVMAQLVVFKPRKREIRDDSADF
jgi:hypothetical protein